MFVKVLTEDDYAIPYLNLFWVAYLRRCQFLEFESKPSWRDDSLYNLLVIFHQFVSLVEFHFPC